MTAKCKTLGSSLVVPIPVQLARQAGLRAGATVVVSVVGGALIVQGMPSRPRRNLSSLLRKMSPAAYRRNHGEFSGGMPTGNETW
jgi:antitoxin component of MazEF toxin-antitoxin module